MITKNLIKVTEFTDRWYLEAQTEKCKYGQVYWKSEHDEREVIIKEFLEFYNQFEK